MSGIPDIIVIFETDCSLYSQNLSGVQSITFTRNHADIRVTFCASQRKLSINSSRDSRSAAFLPVNVEERSSALSCTFISPLFLSLYLSLCLCLYLCLSLSFPVSFSV